MPVTRRPDDRDDDDRPAKARGGEVEPLVAPNMDTPGWSNQNAIRHPAATGAAAGSPGSFTPAGCARPVNLAALTGIVAAPATAWTTGQHVQLADWSNAYWNATAWTAGKAA